MPSEQTQQESQNIYNNYALPRRTTGSAVAFKDCKDELGIYAYHVSFVMVTQALFWVQSRNLVKSKV